MSDWSRSPLRNTDPPAGGAGSDPTPAGPGSGMDAAAEAALAAAREAIASLASDANSAGGAPAMPIEPGSVEVGDEAPSAGTPIELPKFQPSTTSLPPKAIDLLANVALKVRIELGRTRMLVEDVLRLGDGSVIELDKLAGDPVDIYVNDRPVAKGEVLVLNDNFCVRINEIVDPSSLDGGAKAGA